MADIGTPSATPESRFVVRNGQWELPGDPGKLNSGASGLTGIGVSNRGKRSDAQRMDDYEYGQQVHGAISDAMLYIDGYIAPDRALANAYYLGRLFGNEEEGRSQVVMTEVRDTILAIIPDLLRIFAASTSIVDFIPSTARTVEQAEQATDYVNHIFWNDNNGFLILHNSFKDALTVRTGVIKWRWSEDIDISEAEYTDLRHEQVMLLTQEPDTEIVDLVSRETQPAFMLGDVEIVPATVFYDIRIRRKKTRQRVVLETVPSEEFLIDRETRDLDTSRYIGHRSLKTVSDLVAMGYDREEIEGISNSDDAYYLTNLEAITRNPAINIFSRDTGPNSALKRFVYVESWIRIDRDGDGIAELRKVCSIGPHILHDEVADEVPFAVFCPDPTPHMMIGQSVADQTMDLQLIKSAMVRDLLDSLKQSINPRTWGVEGQVNFDDLMNVEIGNVIRMRQPGMAGQLDTPFVGQALLPILQYVDFVRTIRTGISDASKGIDPDALQSTTAAGVNATVEAGEQRKEMIARIFAGDGMKRLMKGIYRMVVRHQDRPRIIRLRGKFVEMDPRFWDADLDCIPNVALGRGGSAEQLKALGAIAAKQEGIIQLLGPGNPMVPMSKYRETLAQICHIAGFKDESKFFAEIDDQQLAQMIQQASQGKPQDPTVMLAQIEQAKVQVSAQKAAAENQQKQQEMMLTHQREMEKMRLDAAVKLAVAEMQATGQFNSALIENIISRDLAIAQGAQQAETDRHATMADFAARIAQEHIAANAPQPNGSANG
jgi:hypothetical protein